MARWSIGSYNRFISAVRKDRPGTSVKDARAIYTQFRNRLDRPVFQTDIKKHPRIFSQEATRAEFNKADRVSEEFFEEMPDEVELDEEEEWEIGGKADYAKKK